LKMKVLSHQFQVDELKSDLNVACIDDLCHFRFILYRFCCFTVNEIMAFFMTL
jgi:hypothetical protein